MSEERIFMIIIMCLLAINAVLGMYVTVVHIKDRDFGSMVFSLTYTVLAALGIWSILFM